MPPPDLLAVLALVALLVVAYRHPRPVVEVAVALGASALALGSGLLDLDDAVRTLADLAPVVVFLVTILVVSHVCDRAGLFAAMGGILRTHPTRLFTIAFLLGATVTAILSLDATVVLLTPVVLAASRASGTPTGPGAYACLRMANSASLLLPISNLTNLLAVPRLHLGFTGFALTMAPVLAVVLLVEYVGLRLLFRRDLPRRAPPSATPTSAVGPPLPFPLVPAATVALMLLTFVLISPLGLAPAWVSAPAAGFLVVWGRRRGLLRARDAAGAAHLEFTVLVLALGVVVAVVSAGGLRHELARLVPDHASGFVPLLVIALVATALANAVTNLSATLLLVPLVAPLGDTAVLAALLGLNIGAGLTLTGSLANLLWRRGLDAAGERPCVVAFYRVSLLLTPISLVAAVATLNLVAR